jgi:opacity protein-like surface antigen
MQRLWVIVLVLCAAGAATVAAAAVAPIAPKISFGVHGDFSLGNLPGPAIDNVKALQNAYGPGYGGGAHLGVEFATLSLRLSGDYLRYSLDEGRFRDSYAGVFGGAVNQLSVDGGELGITSITANAKMSVLPLPIVRPYLTGGVGLAWLSVAEAKTSIAGVPGRTFPSSHQDAKTSLNLGAGVDLSLGVTLFVETRYIWILTEGEKSTFVPVMLGVTF